MVWGFRVGLCGFSALRGLCGFCVREWLGGYKARCVFAFLFVLLSCFYALCQACYPCILVFARY